MNVKATVYVTKLFEQFGALFSLPTPPAEYITGIQAELANKKWTVGRLRDALEYLKYSKDYNTNAQFNRYPTIFELVDADWIMRN